MYDVDSILISCGIQNWGNKRLEVISQGNNVEIIRKKGIFAEIDDRRKCYIVRRGNNRDTIVLLVFNSFSNRQADIQVVRKGEKYFVVKRGMGAY
jgi:hypothetical protein